jgi:hypothetical protein
MVLVGDAYSRPPITIRCHDLHVDDIRRAMSEKASYHERTSFFLFLVPIGYASFDLSLAFPLCLLCDGFGHWSFIAFLYFRLKDN